jgi:hypothetical protein
MEVIVNIGLAVGTNGNIGTGTALRELAQAGFTIDAHAVHRSETELTVVAHATFAGNEAQAHNAGEWLAMWLSQDCIAVYVPATGNGRLVGPRAAAWGEFNPEYFIQLDGTRLAAPALARAA